MRTFKKIIMKQLLYLIVITFVCISCGGSKKVITTAQPEPEVQAETVIETKQDPPEIETDVIDVPQETDIEVEIEREEETTEMITPKEPLEEAEIIEDTILFPNHASFGELLAAYVTPQGNVNYNGFKNNWSALRTYIKDLDTHMPTDNWSKNDKLAYWMNAYNAMTIDLILRHQPLESIKDIKDPWDQRFWKLGDKYYNLNEIEHKILRKMGDARIHFGINCASFSCPPLLNEAFTADKVNAQLDQLARTFVNDSQRNTITANSIEVSKIFTWFAKDFKTNGTLIDFLNQYSDVTIAPNAKKRYKEYDWALNK